MPASNYTNIIADIKAKAKTIQPMDWYRSQVNQLSVSKSKLRVDLRKQARLSSTVEVGKMYLFTYDPKFKDTLPVYDTYPLVFPFAYASGGFLGINLHYMPYGMRVYTLQRLEKVIIKQTLTTVRKAAISWQILNDLVGYGSLNDCVKHYLLAHIRSSYMEIEYEDWRLAAALPVQNFIRNY